MGHKMFMNRMDIIERRNIPQTPTYKLHKSKEQPYLANSYFLI